MTQARLVALDEARALVAGQAPDGERLLVAVDLASAAVTWRAELPRRGDGASPDRLLGGRLVAQGSGQLVASGFWVRSQELLRAQRTADLRQPPREVTLPAGSETLADVGVAGARLVALVEGGPLLVD